MDLRDYETTILHFSSTEFLLTRLVSLVIFWVKSGHLTHSRGFWVPFWHIYSRLKNPVQNRGEKWKNEKVNFRKVSRKEFFRVSTKVWVLVGGFPGRRKKLGFFTKKHHFWVC